MHDSVKNLKLVKDKVNEIIIKKQLKTNPTIIAVSKTFDLNKIFPVIEYGHLDFGENKVQEAEDKWTKFKSTNKNIKLHMLGKLQSNKVKKAVKLFDFIHFKINNKKGLFFTIGIKIFGNPLLFDLILVPRPPHKTIRSNFLMLIFALIYLINI